MTTRSGNGSAPGREPAVSGSRPAKDRQAPESTPQPVTAFLAHRLVAARRRLDMSQAELARRLAVDQSTVSRLERGDMQGPPWGLVLRACLHLCIEPHALMVEDVEPVRRPNDDSRFGTCRPLAVVRARISHHFLYVGIEEGRLPELMQYCLQDVMKIRTSVVGISMLLFDWLGRETRQVHAQWHRGDITFAVSLEREELPPTVRELQRCWEAGEPVIRTQREELVGWPPRLVVDVPMDYGLLGFDFSDDEDLKRDDTLEWVTNLAETFNTGLRLVRASGTGMTDDMRRILARLTSIEARLEDRG